MYILFLSLFCLLIVLALLTFAIANSHTKNNLEKKVDKAFRQTQIYENINQKEIEPESQPNAKAFEIVLNIGEAQVKHGRSIEGMNTTHKEIKRCVEVYESTQQQPLQFKPKQKPVLRVIKNQINSK
ncbi:hypothetical protein [Pseudoalteromonas rubra]|uniref:hypothetical protein n=1 Tax=Pseudoalteromonas rubra TaxID=43658 RepID=UPI002DBC5961|nr:hypothetical protein [Pseudoalteromonas rubra]MEC4090124.1 hypothetical protein [Pseudoalteromonas rubra]